MTVSGKWIPGTRPGMTMLLLEAFHELVVLRAGHQLRELIRLLKTDGIAAAGGIGHLLMPGLLGMVFSFGAGLLALYCLSRVLEKGKWIYFGLYCWVAAAFVFILSFYLN